MIPTDFDPLLRTLEAHDMRHAYAGYWIAWRIVFESDERIIAVPGRGRLLMTPHERGRHDPGEAGRYPAYYRAVATSPSAAYVFLAGSPMETAHEVASSPRGTSLRTADFIVYVRARRA